ncbi:MAG: DUF4276 family protein [Methanobacteriota archaeon]
MRLGLIVEGKGDEQALPVLLRRIIPGALVPEVEILSPLRQHRSTLVAADGLERAVRFLRHKVGGEGAILVLVDANGDPPCVKGPELLQRSHGPASALPLGVVLARREFEAWFLGALESLRGVRGIRPDAASPQDPESIADAKGYLSRFMEDPRIYRPTADQAALAARFDVPTSRSKCPSLDKLIRDVERLTEAGGKT